MSPEDCGDTESWLGNILATGLLVAAWGFFLYQGALDPAGIAKSLWPIFGIANQLLAVIAFCLGTTILIKMGKARYCWVTAVPLVFLTSSPSPPAIMKIFSPNAAGFLPAIAKLEAQSPAASTGEALKQPRPRSSTPASTWSSPSTFLILRRHHRARHRPRMLAAAHQAQGHRPPRERIRPAP